jgi:hypothetical protein
LTAIQKSGSRNFWVLQNYLPAETRGHVKRFIATHYYFEGYGSITTLTKGRSDRPIKIGGHIHHQQKMDLAKAEGGRSGTFKTIMR